MYHIAEAWEQAGWKAWKDVLINGLLNLIFVGFEDFILQGLQQFLTQKVVGGRNNWMWMIPAGISSASWFRSLMQRDQKNLKILPIPCTIPILCIISDVIAPNKGN